MARPPHSAIADLMARRSASGIPADLSASASGQPLRPRRRCFRGADDSGRGPREIIAGEAMDSITGPRGDDTSGGAGLRKVHRRSRWPDAPQFFSTTCYARPASLVTAMSVRRWTSLASSGRPKTTAYYARSRSPSPIKSKGLAHLWNCTSHMPCSEL